MFNRRFKQSSSHRLNWVLVIFCCIIQSISSAAKGTAVPPLSQGIENSVLQHIRVVAAIGPHAVGSAGERTAIGYVRDQFKAAGLETIVEEFTYERFILSTVDFRLNGKTMPVQLVGFNPYANVHSFSGRAIMLNPDAKSETPPVKDHAVVIPGQGAYFRLVFQGASVIICMDPDTFQKVATADTLPFSLDVHGKMKTGTSANVVGFLPATEKTDREILITCHLDAYQQSPGANDNGTGIGSVIELARIFARQHQQRSCNIRFVAFGGEEVGLLGSRQYFARHKADLEHCAMVFNIDTTGDGALRLEMDGGVTEAYSKKGHNHLPAELMDKAWEGPNGLWRINHPEILPPLVAATMLPDWLTKIAQDTCKSLPFSVTSCKGIFSDGRVFAQAGIPTSGVAQTPGSKILHTADDRPERVDPQQVRRSMEVSYNMLSRTMRHFSQ